MNSEFLAWQQQAGLNLSAAQLEQFDRFEEALYAWNERKNLTRVPREEAWTRHFADSLVFHDLIPAGSSVADLGTGPGLPAWPLACARPDLQVTAVDSNGKMLEFLRTQPLPNLTVVQVRAEEWGVREQFDVVTGRAVAPFPLQMELSAAPCRIGGQVIPMRTSDDWHASRSFPASRLGLRLREVIQRELPAGPNRMFPIYEKSRATPAKYPRHWADMKIGPIW